MDNVARPESIFHRLGALKFLFRPVSSASSARKVEKDLDLEVLRKIPLATEAESIPLTDALLSDLTEQVRLAWWEKEQARIAKSFDNRR